MLFSTTLLSNPVNRIAFWDLHERYRNGFTRSPANPIHKTPQPAGNRIRQAPTGHHPLKAHKQSRKGLKQTSGRQRALCFFCHAGLAIYCD
jgi:hypothetical protein